MYAPCSDTKNEFQTDVLTCYVHTEQRSLGTGVPRLAPDESEVDKPHKYSTRPASQQSS